MNALKLIGWAILFQVVAVGTFWLFLMLLCWVLSGQFPPGSVRLVDFLLTPLR